MGIEGSEEEAEWRKPFRVPPVATLRSAWTPVRAAVGAAAAAAAVHECVEIVSVGMVAPTVGFGEAAAVAAEAETTGF